MKTRPEHAVLLTQEYKIEWFSRLITQRSRIAIFEGPEDTREFLRGLRDFFKFVHDRDVPGYFVRKIAEKCGLPTTMSPSTVIKRDWAFELMDLNANYRENKTDLVRAMENYFSEKTLNYIIDDIWEEYHAMDSHPEPKKDVDAHGQESLF